MELGISLALGAWISFGGWLAYKSLLKEFKDNSISFDQIGTNK